MSGAPPRVLLIVTTTAGGAGEQAFQLARAIDRSAVDLTVAYGTGYPLDEDFARLGQPVVHLAMTRSLSPIANLRALFQIRSLLQRESFDVVATSCSMAGFCGRVAARLAGVGTTVHIIQVYASRPHQLKLRRLFFRQIERWLDKLTTRYVAVSRAVKSYGVDTGLMPDSKVDVIYNAAELADVDEHARSKVRGEIGVPPDAPVIGTLGRYERQKGLQYFLQAAARVRETFPDAHFLVVGEGPLEARLRAQAEQLGIADAVVFTGWRRDVPEVLRAIDVFCLASLWETFGIALAEAMLARLPIVATRVDGIPEVVADGETGLLVPSGDAEALAAGLSTLLADPERARAMGEAGRERSLELFSVETMVRDYERLFRELAGADDAR